MKRRLTKFEPVRSSFFLGGQMRNFFADQEYMVVNDVVDETHLMVQKQGWPNAIKAPVRAGNTTDGYSSGQTVVVRWENADSQRRFVDGIVLDPLLNAAEDQEVRVWRFYGDFAHCYGANLQTEMPGETLALTEISAQFWGIHTVVHLVGSAPVMFGLRSTNYDDLAVICAINLTTGATLWTQPIACADFDGFPQVEYLPGHHAIVVHGDQGHLLGFYDGAILCSWDRGAGVWEYENDSRWLNVTPFGSSLYRYVKPVEHPDHNSESHIYFGVSQLWTPIRIFQTAFANTPTEGPSGYFNYAAADHPRDILADGTLHVDTPMFYCHATQGLEVATDNDILVRAFTGFGFAYWGIDVPTPVKNITYLGLESVPVTGPIPDDPDPPFPVYGTTTIDRTAIDRVGFKVIFESESITGGSVNWEWYWESTDHTSTWYGLDNCQDALDEYLAERLENLQDAAGGLHDEINLEGYTLSDPPVGLSISIDTAAEHPGGHPHFGSSMTWGLGNVGHQICESDGTIDFSGKYFERNWVYSPFNSSVADIPYANTLRIPLTCKVLSVKMNGNKAVIMYQTPSCADYVAVQNPTEWYFFQRWAGAKTGSVANTEGGFDYQRSYPDIGHDYIGGKFCATWEEMQGLNPDTGPINYSHAAVADSPWIYYYRRPEGADPFWLVLTPNTPLDARGKNYVYRGLTPTTSYFIDTGPPGGSGDETYYIWEGEWRIASEGVDPVVEYGRDFEYLCVPRGQTVPRGGLTGMFVLEIDAEVGSISQLARLEFGADAYLYSGSTPVTVDGVNVLTSGYPPVETILGQGDGFFVIRQNFDWPNRLQGDHTTLVERYDWTGTNTWWLAVPDNPWQYFFHAGYDPDAEKDWLLVQDSYTWELHLYDQDGFVRSYAALEGYMDLSSSFVTNGEVYFTVYDSPEYDGDQETWNVRVVKL